MQIPLPLAALCAGAAGYLLGRRCSPTISAPACCWCWPSPCAGRSGGRIGELAAMVIVNGRLLPSASMTVWGMELPVQLLAAAACR